MGSNRASRFLFALVTAFCAFTPTVSGAADASSERTTMPDFCSNRNVTCVLPDATPAMRRGTAAASGTTHSAATGSTSGSGSAGGAHNRSVSGRSGAHANSGTVSAGTAGAAGVGTAASR